MIRLHFLWCVDCKFAACLACTEVYSFNIYSDYSAIGKKHLGSGHKSNQTTMINRQTKEAILVYFSAPTHDRQKDSWRFSLIPTDMHRLSSIVYFHMVPFSKADNPGSQVLERRLDLWISQGKTASVASKITTYCNFHTGPSNTGIAPNRHSQGSSSFKRVDVLQAGTKNAVELYKVRPTRQ